MPDAIIEIRSGASLRHLRSALEAAGVREGDLVHLDRVHVAPLRPAGTGPERDRLDAALARFGISRSTDAGDPAVIADPDLNSLLDSVGPRHQPIASTIMMGESGSAMSDDGAEVIRVTLVANAPASGLIEDALIQLETNIDDMSPQFFEMLGERLFANGALDVWTSAIAMKKQRPAVCVHALARPENRAALIEAIIENSTTLGVREIPVQRHSVPRRFEVVETRWGSVQIKLKIWRGRVADIAPEYDDCVAIARNQDVPVKEIWHEAYNLGQVYIGRRVTDAPVPTLRPTDPLAPDPEFA